MTKSQLRKKRYIKLGDEYSFIKDSQDITINQVPDAVYLKASDILHFKKLSSISKIFPGISELFREATHEETEVFLENDFISLKNNFKAESVRQSNRKRIALSIEKLNSYSEEQKKAVFGNIRHYYPNLINKNGAFEVSNDNELKLLLYGIDQRFYTTADGTEKRIANSIIKT